MTEPRLAFVKCLDSRGLHRVAYWEWGDPANPRVLVCAHGLSRQGRDFDTLARDLSADWRVICPDIAGRGRSDWLADPAGYAIPNYVADMVTLVARLGVEQVDWVGTSMGGLIGLGLAGLPGSPVRRLILNDVGPAIESVALQRIGGYLGMPAHWRSVDEAADALWAISQGFGPHTREQWLALTRPQLVPDGDGFKPHYDPAIALGLRAITPALAAAGEAMLWQSYDRLRCPTLLLRGADSDLLSPATAQAMTERGPRGPAARVRRRRPCADAGATRSACGGARVPARAMKPPADGPSATAQGAAAIVHLASAPDAHEVDPEQRARAFAEPLLSGQRLDTGEDASAMPRAWPRCCAPSAAAPALCAAAYLVYAGDHLQRPEEMVRKAFGASYASVVALTRKLVQIQRAARAAQGGEATRAAADRAACARCCWPSRATCAWCCCAWPRACRRCAGTRRSRRAARPTWRASRSRCSRRWPTGSASGRSSGRSRTWRSASCSREDYQRIAGLLDERRVEREQRVRAAVARAGSGARARRAAGRGAGPAQAPLQHLEEDAGQEARPSSRCSTCARCA